MNHEDLRFPDKNYQATLTKFVDYFKAYPGVYAVVLTGSLARGKAVEGSCIDIYVFLTTRQLNALASTINSRVNAYRHMGGQIAYYQGNIEGGVHFGKVRVDVGFADGRFKRDHVNSFDITRDELETTTGNLLAYSVSLYEKGKRFETLKKKYLPFYDEALRKIRLKGTEEEFAYKIWKTRWLAKRGEYFAAFYALLEAEQIFLQHLFIKERKYPIDYVKWLKEQCSEILCKPELYQKLARIVNGTELSRNGVTEKSNLLEKLFAQY